MLGSGAVEYLDFDAEEQPWRERLLELPLFYKVLGANAAVILVGAVAGTAITLKVAGETSSAFNLVVIFAILGTLASIVVNWIALRAALRPLQLLEQTVDEVRQGNFRVRAPKVAFSDPSIDTLVETFNGMLDTVERYRARLHEMSMRVLDAQEEERKRISRELHDNTAQVLTAQLLRLKTIEDRGEMLDVAGLERLIENTARALEEVRHMAHELRPPSLDDLGLQASLEGLAVQYGERFNLTVRVGGDRIRQRLSPDCELAVYRIVQEALTNVAKHARARLATVTIGWDPALLRVRVADDGRGFLPESLPRLDGAGLGIFGMQERAALVGGAVTIVAEPGSGTSVNLTIPLGDHLAESPADAAHVLSATDQPRDQQPERNLEVPT